MYVCMYVYVQRFGYRVSHVCMYVRNGTAILSNRYESSPLVVIRTAIHSSTLLMFRLSAFSFSFSCCPIKGAGIVCFKVERVS